MNRQRIFSIIGMVIALAILPAAQAKAPPRYQGSPDESQLIEHGSYTNKAGNQVHSPAHTKDGNVPSGASAKCRDGSYSFSRSHRGTCSRHGGVSAWLK